MDFLLLIMINDGVRNIFRKYVKVEDVFLWKKRKGCSYSFGFVRFVIVVDVEKVIRKNI